MIYHHNSKLLLLASLLFLAAITIPLSVKLSQNDSRSQSAAQAPTETILTFTVYFHGLGESGDSLSPGNTKFSTKEPTFNKKTVTANIYNSSNQLVLSRAGSLEFNREKGFFSSGVPIGNSLPTGNYTIRVGSTSYLWKRVPGSINIKQRADNKIPVITMIAGDFNGDNSLDTLDYNILMGCYSDLLDASFCDTQLQTKTDISADFEVNALDYNLFLREIAIVQKGE